MRELPILYSTPMVLALIEGRKTKTRRINGLETFNENPNNWKFQSLAYHEKAGLQAFFVPVDTEQGWYGAKCPYGKPGDLLWVRETFRPSEFTLNGYTYKANAHPEIDHTKGWKPSIHMPKAAARIWLKITEIRVQRLQDITEADAIAEGAKDLLILNDMKLLEDLDWILPRPFQVHQFGFLSIWCGINGTKSWEANPWVWVLSFDMVSTTGKPKEVKS